MFFRIDAAEDALARYANDNNKDPNSSMRKIYKDKIPHLCLFAITQIKSGDEITYNYGDGFYPWRKSAEPCELNEIEQQAVSSDEEVVFELPVDVEEEEEGEAADQDDDDKEDDATGSEYSYDGAPGSLLGELMEQLDDAGFSRTSERKNIQSINSSAINKNIDQDRPADEFGEDQPVVLNCDKINPPGPSQTSTQKDKQTANICLLNHDSDLELSSDESVDKPMDVTGDTNNPAGRSQTSQQKANRTTNTCICAVNNDTDSSLSSDDSDDDEPMDVTRDKTTPAIYIRKIIKSSTKSSGEKKKTLRVHNSYQHCGVCHKKVSNFSQHVRRKNPTDVHNRDPDLKRALNIKDRKEQSRQLCLIRNKFNHDNNVKTLQLGKGELILERRPAGDFVKESYGPCPSCFAWFITSALYKHQEHCPANTKKKLTIAEIVTQSGVLSEKINRCASPKLVAEVFSIMHNDEVSDVARSDRLVIVLGNQWMEKNIGNTLKRGKYTSEIMRLVAHLLIALRKVAGKQMSMWDFLNPENFDNIVKATPMVAVADMDDEDDLLYPSNARKLGFE